MVGLYRNDVLCQHVPAAESAVVHLLVHTDVPTCFRLQWPSMQLAEQVVVNGVVEVEGVYLGWCRL